MSVYYLKCSFVTDCKRSIFEVWFRDGFQCLVNLKTSFVTDFQCSIFEV